MLASIRRIPVHRWNYINDEHKTAHIGPFAQDFYREFGLGADSLGITTQDISGVNMAAIRALEERTSRTLSNTDEIERLQSENQALQTKVSALESRLSQIEALLSIAGE